MANTRSNPYSHFRIPFIRSASLISQGIGGEGVLCRVGALVERFRQRLLNYDESLALAGHALSLASGLSDFCSLVIVAVMADLALRVTFDDSPEHRLALIQTSVDARQAIAPNLNNSREPVAGAQVIRSQESGFPRLEAARAGSAASELAFIERPQPRSGSSGWPPPVFGRQSSMQ
jgi:hypothetical protein